MVTPKERNTFKNSNTYYAVRVITPQDGRTIVDSFLLIDDCIAHALDRIKDPTEIGRSITSNTSITMRCGNCLYAVAETEQECYIAALKHLAQDVKNSRSQMEEQSK